MCKKNIYTDVFPEKTVEFHQTLICRNGEPGSPCKDFTTHNYEPRILKTNEISTKDMLALAEHQKPLARSRSVSVRRTSHLGGEEAKLTSTQVIVRNVPLTPPLSPNTADSSHSEGDFVVQKRRIQVSPTRTPRTSAAYIGQTTGGEQQIMQLSPSRTPKPSSGDYVKRASGVEKVSGVERVAPPRRAHEPPTSPPLSPRIPARKYSTQVPSGDLLSSQRNKKLPSRPANTSPPPSYVGHDFDTTPTVRRRRYSDTGAVLSARQDPKKYRVAIVDPPKASEASKRLFVALSSPATSDFMLGPRDDGPDETPTFNIPPRVPTPVPYIEKERSERQEDVVREPLPRPRSRSASRDSRNRKPFSYTNPRGEPSADTSERELERPRGRAEDLRASELPRRSQSTSRDERERRPISYVQARRPDAPEAPPRIVQQDHRPREQAEEPRVPQSEKSRSVSRVDGERPSVTYVHPRSPAPAHLPRETERYQNLPSRAEESRPRPRATSPREPITDHVYPSSSRAQELETRLSREEREREVQRQRRIAEKAEKAVRDAQKLAKRVSFQQAQFAAENDEIRRRPAIPVNGSPPTRRGERGERGDYLRPVVEQSRNLQSAIGFEGETVRREDLVDGRRGRARGADDDEMMRRLRERQEGHGAGEPDMMRRLRDRQKGHDY